jgi:acyl-coenzyme A synthetase/AMP-(fatty) acid ligase
VDRKKELIKYKGFQVPPAELEGILLQHPSVAVAAVVGIYDAAQATELPRAYVQLHAGVAPSAELPRELQEWVKERTSAQKRLRGGVRVLEHVPVSASGKVLRKEMRALAKREQEALEGQPKARL